MNQSNPQLYVHILTHHLKRLAKTLQSINQVIIFNKFIWNDSYFRINFRNLRGDWRSGWVHLSNTLFIEGTNKSWTGILVEANNEAFKI